MRILLAPLLASGAAHVALVWALGQGRARQPRGPSAASTEVAFAIQAHEYGRASEPTVGSGLGTSQGRPRRRKRGSTAAVAVSASAPPDAPAGGTGPLGRETPADRGTSAAELDVRPSPLAEDLAAYTRRQMREASPFQERPPPLLHARPGGGYAYDGHLFRAEIEPDGTLHFSDTAVQPQGLGFSFDLNDALQRANGADPYRAERRWFAEQTDPLRARLRRAFLARVRSESLGQLERRLAEIWRDRRMSVAERRRALFEQWDECDDGAAGGIARNLIEQFVREHLPISSPDAYGSTEIDRINRDRRSGRAPFDPYARPRTE